MKTLVVLLALLAFAASAQAIGWEGFDYPAEITNKTDSLSPDETAEDDVEIYDSPSGEYGRGYLDVKPGDSDIPPEFEDRELPKIDLGQ